MREPRDSDDLLPLHQPFEITVRGFNRRQVLEHLEALDGRIAMITADRDAALAQVAELSKVLNHLRLESELLEHLREETEKAKSQVERLLTNPMRQTSARIERIMQLAQEEAAELKTSAEAQITTLRDCAEREIAELKASAEEQITTLRAHASREAKALLERAKRQCEQLEADSAARREAAEQAAAARIRDREVRAVARMHLLLWVIGERLANRIRMVERDETALRELQERVSREAKELEAVRGEVTAALDSAHQLLSEALEQVRKTAMDAMGQVDAPTPPAVPAQRGAEGGTVYLLNTAEDQKRPSGL